MLINKRDVAAEKRKITKTAALGARGQPPAMTSSVSVGSLQSFSLSIQTERDTFKVERHSAVYPRRVAGAAGEASAGRRGRTLGGSPESRWWFGDSVPLDEDTGGFHPRRAARGQTGPSGPTRVSFGL